MNLPQNSNFPAPSPRTPAPAIDPVFAWPTPEERDYLFYVEKNGDLPVNKTWEYGTAHPDAARYPNHRLVYVSPQSPDKWSKWFYAAERILQDEYNWEMTNADVSGTKFDAVKRTYLFLRSEHNAVEPLMGTGMPNIPVNKFNTAFVLAERRQLQSPEIEVTSIFIMEERVYIKRCSITTIQTDDFFGIGGSKVDNLYYRGEVVDGSAVEVHFATPNSSYWGWQADGSIRDGKQLSCSWFLISIINSITDVIDDYAFSYPSFTNLNLPRRITGSQVAFNVSKGEGNMDQEATGVATGPSLSMSVGLTDSCSSSVSISPELGLTFFEPNGSFTPCMVYSFFLERPVTIEDIITRVSALHGSTVALYRPPDTTSSLITLISASASVRANATASVSQSGAPGRYADFAERSVSVNKQVSQSTQFVQISNVAGGLTLNESQSDTVGAEAAMSVWIAGALGSVTSSAFIEDSVDVEASVRAAVGEDALNPGSSGGAFITRINVDPYLFERAKLFVEVVDLP